MSMSNATISYIDTEARCGIAIFALLVYDWSLCLGQEVKFIWTWRSKGITLASLVYLFSRYALIIEMLLSIMTIYPMSDLSCRADVWTATVLEILGLTAFTSFSALRAYALSNRSIWIAVIIVLLALPPVMMRLVEWVYQEPQNLPGPYNCTATSPLSPIVPLSVGVGSQLMAELLVVGITWWYTYQSYRIQKGVKLGKTISSVLFYNGSMYFLCLATLYIIDLIGGTPLVPVEIQDVGALFDLFIDPITSILTCRFMLSLRQFDSTVASTSGPQLRELTASTVLQFGAHSSDSLPGFIASFSHPVHVDSDANIDNRNEGPEFDTGASGRVEGAIRERPISESRPDDSGLVDWV